MFVTYGVRRSALAVVAVVGLVLMTSAPAFAQEAKDPNPGSDDAHRISRLPESVHVPRDSSEQHRNRTWPAMDLGISPPIQVTAG